MTIPQSAIVCVPFQPKHFTDILISIISSVTVSSLKMQHIFLVSVTNKNGFWILLALLYNYSSHIELILNDVCLTNLSLISGWSLLYFLNSRIHCVLLLPRGPQRRHHVEQLIVLCCSTSRRGNPVTG
jgi:hypothetical protein